jgi:uncharacterized protein with PIN domain
VLGASLSYALIVWLMGQSGQWLLKQPELLRWANESRRVVVTKDGAVMKAREGCAALWVTSNVCAEQFSSVCNALAIRFTPASLMARCSACNSEGYEVLGAEEVRRRDADLPENKRVYPNGPVAAHVLGFANVDNIGIAGMEKHIDGMGLSDLTMAGFRLDPADLKPVQLSLDLRVTHAIRDELEKGIDSIRLELNSTKPHAMEGLQAEARRLASESSAIEQSSRELKEVLVQDRSHRNELLSLSTRFRRSQSAREVLGGVNFVDCPQCGRDLPERPSNECPVCGQEHLDVTSGNFDEASAERDLDNRVAELDDLIKRHDSALRRNDRILRELKSQKTSVDSELNRVARDYDSAYLSTALETEKQRAAIRQQLSDLERIEVLVQRIVNLNERVDRLTLEERKTRMELKGAREKAEKDTENLGRLKTLFLDCLLRSKLTGFYSDDRVEMKSPHFLPEVTSAGEGDLAVTSFGNLGSGGKKTLFKCCFAVAIHRLASEIGALLPSLLIIDSPMKNTSERQNREQFEAFMKMLYELSLDELKDTQFIVVDKELCRPPGEYSRSFFSREMRPNERKKDPTENLYPPLIPYYQDK